MLKSLKTVAVGFVLAVILAGAGLLASAPSPAPVAALGPDSILGLNSSNCVALGAAFGGLDTAAAVDDCLGLGVQNVTPQPPPPADFQPLPPGSITHFVGCLRGSDELHNGKNVCIRKPVGKITPADFTKIDLDKNQVYPGQQLIIIAFVNSDASVLFKTDLGQLTDTSFNTVTGKEFTCIGGSATGTPAGDPDCDGNAATVGDGVVAVKLTVQPKDGTGVGHVTAIQNGVGIPMEFRVTGKPRTIEVKGLFGKDTIQTGATAPSKDSTVTPLDTDCSFAATAAAVLGANNSPEKAVLVATVKDTDGVPVVGALLFWDHTFVHSPGSPPLGTPDADPLPQGGVALPATPTLDTGPLGISFPQFVCGGKEPGEMKLKVRFTNLLDGGASDPTTFVNVVVHVVGPPATITLAADPPTVDCNGTNASKVTVTAITAAGVPVADGADANFSVSVLGSANPLVANTSKGVASTSVTPLSAANSTTSGPKGVPVIVTVGSIQSSILVKCSGAAAAAPPPAGGAPAGGAGAGGTAPGGGAAGTIRGPDTGSGFAGSQGALSWWPALGLVAAALALVGVNRLAFKRED